jgi:hypothetical protein
VVHLKTSTEITASSRDLEASVFTSTTFEPEASVITLGKTESLDNYQKVTAEVKVLMVMGNDCRKSAMYLGGTSATQT